MKRYERYYVPNNATLIFAGNFDALSVIQHVDTHFGSMQPGNDCHPVHAPEDTNGQRSVELKIDAPCP